MINQYFQTGYTWLQKLFGEFLSELRKDKKDIIQALDHQDLTTAVLEANKAITDEVNMMHQGVVEAINSQEKVESVEISNLDELTSKVGEVITALKEELGKIDKEIVVKNDLSSLTALFKSGDDKKDLLKALKNIENKIKTPEITDYTLILSELVSLVEGLKPLPVDLKGIEELLAQISVGANKFALPDESFTYDKRVKVELPDSQVKKIAQSVVVSSGGGNTSAVVDAINNLQLGGIPANKATDAYSYQALSTTATHLYVFKEDGTGNWYIQRFLLSTMESDYAKGTGGYQTVYVDNVSEPSGSLTWGTYDEIFDNVGAESLNFDTNGNLKVNIQSPLESNGAVPVNIQDQFTGIVNTWGVKTDGVPMTLSANTVVGSYTLTMNAGHTFAIGDHIYIFYANHSFFAKVLNVATNTLTLDTPIDYVFPSAGSIVFEVTVNMAVDGSSTPQIFLIATGATSTISLDIYSLRINILDNTAMDEATFGGISALTRGLVCRKVSADGSQTVYWNAKTNGELSLLVNNTEYSSKAPAGQYAVSFQWRIKDSHGVSIRLNPGDRLELVVQDNLTALTDIRFTVQGHEVTD